MKKTLKTAFFTAVLGHGLLALQPLFAANADANAVFELHATSDDSTITERHESGSVVFDNKLYAFGGRQIKPVEYFDPVANKWTTLGVTPWEINHFQPVVYDDKVYAIGAFECCYPQESIHENILIYDPSADIWSTGATIPADRLRGSGGSVLYNDKIYFVGGNTLGHNGGAVAWFDEYDPVTDTWTELPDAPNARDHFFAAIVGDKLIAATGRQSALPNPFTNTVSAVDVYDFTTGQWSTGQSVVPTSRAGAMVVTFGEEVIFIGGEVATQSSANVEVEAFNPLSGIWRALQPLVEASHTGVAGVLGSELHIVSGSRTKGGGGENDSHQVALLDDGVEGPLDSDADGLTDSDETDVWLTDRLDADTDDDGLSDGEEVNIHSSNPLVADSDEDGLDDFDEVVLGTAVNDPDTDGDTLSDGDEVNTYLTDPDNSDSDGDFLPDDHEINTHLTDPNKADSDSDGLSDSEEINELGTAANDSDSDDDGLDDAKEVQQYQTDPLDSDSDNDGLNDGDEVAEGLDPLTANSDDGEDADSSDNSDDSDSSAPDGGSTGGSDGNDGNDAESDNANTEASDTGDSSGGSGAAFFVLPLLVYALSGRRRRIRCLPVVSG